MMHSFRVGGSPSTFLTGAAVDEIIKTGGWKTESTAQYKIGASELPLLPRVRHMIEAMLRTFG